MSLTKFNGETNNIQGLADKPTQSASQLKALFDKIGADIKTYLNGTLTTEVDTALGTKANSSDVYTKTETNTALETKANSSETYSKAETNNLLNNCKLKGDFAVFTGTINYANRDQAYDLNYPNGFNKSNCVIISASVAPNSGDVETSSSTWEYIMDHEVGDPTGHTDFVNEPMFWFTDLNKNYITFRLSKTIVSARSYSYKIVLMKIS